MNALTTSAANTGLFTDLYELTMAAGYWKAGLAEREAVFQLFFRQHPFGGGYTIAGGLADAIKHLQRLRFGDPEREYLASLKGGGDRPLFEGGFLDHLGQLRFTGDVAAVPEGTVVFPQEPLVRVQGPLLQAQIVETMLLQTINFQSLLATKAARICQAADGDPVIEFGLRRAQGGDGALAAARAAYIGGCAGTSNVLAARRLGIPVKGTHAHSFVMAFPSELEAFDAYVHAMPDNSILLVDTYDTLEGVCHAVTTGRRLRARGHELAGIRLDSGELGRLSIEARRMLDEAGFPEAVIVASNDLDEHQIARLKAQGARIAQEMPGPGMHVRLSAV
jgi:nicotinate phosphoribosyltransferase